MPYTIKYVPGEGWEVSLLNIMKKYFKTKEDAIAYLTELKGPNVEYILLENEPYRWED